MDGPVIVLVWSLVGVGLLGLGYRGYRLTRGGPAADVWGQAVLGLGLVLLALGAADGIAWTRWIALAFAALFALAVMPVWVMAVLIPMRPGPLDYGFTALYWAGLVTIAVAAALA